MAATWNPSDSGAAISFSNGNLTATATSAANKSVRATTFANGLVYWETTVSDTAGGVGAADTTASVSTYIGIDIHGFGYQPSTGNVLFNNTVAANIGTASAGAVIRHAFNRTTKKYWIQAPSGTWNGSGTADPVTGVGGADTSGFTGEVYATASPLANGAVTTANFTGPFTYAIPSGYVAYDRSIGVGAAAGAAAVAGTGGSIRAGVGSSTATASASAVGSTGGGTTDGAGSAAGVGAATGVGGAIRTAAGAASGISAASGIGQTTLVAAGAAAGASTASAVGGAIRAAAGAASGVGAASSIGVSVQASVGSGVGAGVASGVGGRIAQAVAVASGLGSGQAVGGSTRQAAGAANGVGNAAGVAITPSTIIAAVGSAVGLGVAHAIASIRPRPGTYPEAISGNPTTSRNSLMGGGSVVAGAIPSTGRVIANALRGRP